MSDTKEPELFIIHETPIGSIISDCFTFAIMIGAFWVNYTYIGNSIMMQLIITVTIVSWGIRTSKAETIRGRENIIAFLRRYEADDK